MFLPPKKYAKINAKNGKQPKPDRRGQIYRAHRTGRVYDARMTPIQEEQPMQTSYRFVNTNIQDAALNMALDEAILLHHIRGEAPPTLRVFRWSQPSISLGRFQSIEREIESERCQQQGVALVRRPTGGRAVYHRDEFTYSIVIGKREGVPTGIVAAYAYLAQGLMAALQELGVQAVLSDEHVSKHPSAACFASSTQADLTSSGFKLIGSAQVWKDESLLQQGSLPLDDRSSEFFELLRYPSVAARAEALVLYREKTTPLHTFAPEASWDDIALAFKNGFGSALHETFVEGELSASEWELARQLAEEKYSKLVWRKERITLVQ
jgi:lipoate-protein ligase A